jgi:glycine oxidase
MSQSDVVVLGGGIIGAAIAEELSRRGQRVALLERGTIGCEASTAAAGILSSQTDIPTPGPFFDLCQASHRIYPAWVRRLEKVSGIRTGYHRDGILHITFTDAQTRAMQRLIDWQRRRGLAAERWSPAEVVRREPAVNPAHQAGFFFGAEAQVDNAQVMRALAAACRAAGVQVHEHTTVRGLIRKGGAAAGARTDRGEFRAPVVVDSLGSWSGVPPAGLPKLPVIPARGQILAFDAPKRLFRHVVMAEPAYGVQRRDGRLLVGSTIEFGQFERAVTPEGMRAILNGFARLVRPEVLTQCALRASWAGLRPYSRVDVPLLGRAALDGLFIAAGHFRHGILLAPVTARTISDLILTSRSSPRLSAFAPSRFLRP